MSTGIDLRHGRWQTVLSDVTVCNTVICDPPYGARTHEGHTSGERQDGYSSGRLGYASWGGNQITEFVNHWSPLCRGWMVIMTSHDLIPVYELAFAANDRYVFAPLPFVHKGSRVRLQGDGPSCWTTWIIVARPQTKAFLKWGTLPGAYVLPTGTDQVRSEVQGGKPLWLMAELIRDYSKKGDTIVDPCAGGATTLIAAAIHHRRPIGAECDPDTFKKAQNRIKRGYTPSMF